MSAPGQDGYHDVHLPEHPARRGVWQAIADHLSPYVPPGGHVLEIGAGYCHWINAVRAARRVAVDTWRDLPKHAAAGVEARVLDVTTSLGDFGAASFDVVLASNVLEHFDPDTAGRVAAQVRTLLRQGGRVLVIQPNFRLAYRRYFDDYTHRAIFTDVSLPAMLRSQGLRVEAVHPRFLPYSMQGVGRPVPSWLVHAYLRSPVKPGAGQMLVVARKDR
jgi:cyclopropane fatty-acyl-phospholipid synthase-like methyltransferase